VQPKANGLKAKRSIKKSVIQKKMKEELLEDENNGGFNESTAVSGMYEDWFLDYASYVILERAVPMIEDGLKPVQRRILYSLKKMDDGRFHKVANVIGQTMQYHPHGDASIGDALVNLGQKNLLIDCQGNWGDARTGDGAAAARYIEARLTKFALEVSFNADTTDWKMTYDGRKKEPISLPMKFPLLLFQGVEGIAVGLATKIMPHNFVELIKGSISLLKGRKPTIYPDFPTGGKADCSNYNDGLRGGKVRVRARIEKLDKKTLIIKEIPYATTTNSLIDSILKANDKGKIKIQKVIDNTAKEIEIMVSLPTGVSPDLTRDALYAFTDCEVSISPNSCVIIDNKPHFIGVSEILKTCTEQTLALLKLELELNLEKLREKWLFASLEKIFIENRIYRDIEECTTWESVIETIDKGLDPYKKMFFREITEADIVRLTEIRIKRISKFDAFRADEQIRNFEDDIEEHENHLEYLTDYAIDYFEQLLKKYGKGYKRKTELTSFSDIKAQRVAIANQKLYVNRKDGFVGYGLKKDEYIGECSDIDDVIVFRKDGKMVVTKVSDKTFVGKDLIHVAVWKKGNERMTYNLVYVDPASGQTYAKRFNVKAITRDREYDLTNGHPKSKVLYFTANPNGEAEVISIQLSPSCSAKKKQFNFDFSTLLIKGRASKGNILSRYPVKKIVLTEEGVSTLAGIKVWLDPASGRLNTAERGRLLGEFDTGDTIIAFFKDGTYLMTDYNLSNLYPVQETLAVLKFDLKLIVSCVYYHGEKKTHFVKRFQVETTSLNERFNYLNEAKGTKLELLTFDENPVVSFDEHKGVGRKKVTESNQIRITEHIGVKGWKAMGNRLSKYKTNKIKLVD